MARINNCEYFRTKNGYVSGCGFVAAYNKYWKICPYCGKKIIVINIKYHESRGNAENDNS